MIERPEYRLSEPEILFKTKIFLSDNQVEYSRINYGMRDLGVELGGIINCLYVILCLIMYPINKHLYYIKMMGSLFVV